MSLSCRCVSISKLIFCTTILSLSTAYGGGYSFNISDLNNLGSAGVGFYDPNGLTGNLFQSYLGGNYSFLTMPGPGSVTGELPKVAAVFQFSIDPSSTTLDYLAPYNNPNKVFQYTDTILLKIGPPNNTVQYPFSFQAESSINDAGAHWLQAKSTNGQDTWVYESLNLSLNGGTGLIAIATTNTDPLAAYTNASGLYEAPIQGGQGITIYEPAKQIEPVQQTPHSTVYFADQGPNQGGGYIYKANADGTDRQLIVTATNQVNDIYVDQAHNAIYWNWGGTGPYLASANLDGTNQTTHPFGVGTNFTIDPLTNSIYYTAPSTDQVSKISLDGTAATTFQNPDYPIGISFDQKTQEIFWAQTATSDHPDQAGIFRESINGSVATELIHGGAPIDVELDLVNGKMYWTDVSTNSIYRANLDGTQVETVLTGLNHPLYLALDVPDNLLYWSENGGFIKGASLNGTNEFVFASGLTDAGEIFVVSNSVPELPSIGITAIGFGFILAGYAVRRRFVWN